MSKKWSGHGLTSRCSSYALALSLKDGHGKKIRRFYDVTNQHLRALKTMECEPSGPFVTVVLELKLDPGTIFEWQKHTQDTNMVPH